MQVKRVVIKDREARLKERLIRPVGIGDTQPVGDTYSVL